jgi:CPA2 family monovalent cation:H+ antiporter-2
MFREERYSMFKGYFHGISDTENESITKQEVRLHSVIITAGEYAIGRCHDDMQLDSFDVTIKNIRRPNSEGALMSNESLLAEGDVVVLLGQPTGLTNAENALLMGRIANK